MARGELGPVDDDEDIARVVLSPAHIRKSDGKIKPGVFPPSHIKERGLSLLRITRMADAEVERQANAIAGNLPGNQPVGLLVCVASRVRALNDDDDRRALCLFDDPVKDDPDLPDNPAHACAVRSADQNELAVRKMRGQLLEIFGDPKALSGTR